METKQIVSSISNVILTRHTCGQRSGRVAASKCQVLACGFSVRKCYMFIIPKCRGESDLSLCMTSGLAKRMPLRSADIRFKNVFGRRIRRKSVLRSGILFASHAQKSARGVCFPQPCSSDGRRFAASRSRLNYYRIIGSFQQERIR